MKKIIYLLLIQCFPLSLFAQQRLSGTVTEASGEPLPGVSVYIKGTNTGGITDPNGMYNIVVTEGNTVVFSFIGYRTQEVVYEGQEVLNVTLEQDLIGVDEVVVIGYGTTTKKEVTGSITSVKAENFISGDLKSPIGAIQGIIPGLSIVNSNGSDPNQEYTLRLRGLNSFSGGKAPLILVDGVVWNQSLNLLDPELIASIDILKDGSAAAIYGTRATNGVILITLKEPVKGDVRFQFSSYVSVEKVNNDDRWFSPSEYRDLIAEYDPTNADFLDRGTSTNWLDETTRVPVNQNHSLTITGGDNKLSFIANILYKDDQGLFYNNRSRQITPSISISHTGLKDRLKIDYKLLYSNGKRTYAPGGVLGQSLTRNPTEPVYDPENLASNGYFVDYDASGYTNPVAMLNEYVSDGLSNFITGVVNSSFLVTDGFRINFSGSYNTSQSNHGSYKTRFYPLVGYTGDASQSANSVSYYTLEPSFDYKVTIAEHNIQALGGYSFYENVSSTFYGRNYNFDTDNFLYNNLGAGQALVDGLASLSSNKQSNRLIAFYGRLIYNYKYKYLMSASLRYEGSSRFGSANKWGVFPAISVGWRLNEDEFLKDVSWINNLKIRAGLGVTGNQDIPNYQSLPRMAVGGKMYYNGKWVNTYQSANNPNPDLKWEKKSETNIGIDFGLFNRLNGSIEYYVRNISDLLWWYSVPVPPNVYNNIYANVGALENRGIEFLLEANILNSSSFSWTSTVSYSRNRNKVTKLADPSRGYDLDFIKITPAATSWSQMITVGESVGNFWAPIFIGVDETGNAIYEDVSGDGVVNKESIEDRRIVGNEYPDFEFGWQNIIQAGKFDISFSFRGMIGQSLLNYDRIAYENWEPFRAGRNILKSILDRPEYTGPYVYDSRFVDKSSFVKLSNATIGYTIQLPKPYSLRLYVTGNNLLTFTSFEGTDPEQVVPNFYTDTEKFGWDNLTYPYSRTFLFGLNFTF